MPRPPSPNVRQALVAAARAEFARCGLNAARIEDITAAAGFSKATFYLHFASKEHLFGGLVKKLAEDLEKCSVERMRRARKLRLASGPITRRDMLKKTPRYRQHLEMEVAEDVRVLETMWEHRDVMDVLVTGASGTMFEGAAWEMLDGEIERVARDFAEMQGAGACRKDVPPELFGCMAVGTYFLLARRMRRLKKKPDFTSWAGSLSKLMREGNQALESIARPRRPTQVRAAQRRAS